MVPDPLVLPAVKEKFRILRLDKPRVLSRRVLAGLGGNPRSMQTSNLAVF